MKTPHSDCNSESTLGEPDAMGAGWDFGYPLKRFGSLPAPQFDDHKDWLASFRELCSCSSSNSDSDNESISSSVVYDINFDGLVDELQDKDLASLTDSRNMIIVEPSKDAHDSIMIKYLPRTSTELLIFLEFNHDEFRHDPWNPAPHIICAVERGDNVFLCMERLIEYNQPPLKTVANLLDFFKQILEGLTFLHEHNISNLRYSDCSSLMVGISTGTSTSSIERFDRNIHPVRYYYTDYSRAIKVNSSAIEAFSSDIRSCGIMFNRLLTNVPEVQVKLDTFVETMSSGELGADGCRKLFETLCKSLDSSLFDLPMP